MVNCSRLLSRDQEEQVKLSIGNNLIRKLGLEAYYTKRRVAIWFDESRDYCCRSCFPFCRIPARAAPRWASAATAGKGRKSRFRFRTVSSILPRSVFALGSPKLEAFCDRVSNIIKKKKKNIGNDEQNALGWKIQVLDYLLQLRFGRLLPPIILHRSSKGLRF